MRSAKEKGVSPSTGHAVLRKVMQSCATSTTAPHSRRRVHRVHAICSCTRAPGCQNGPTRLMRAGMLHECFSIVLMKPVAQVGYVS